MCFISFGSLVFVSSLCICLANYYIVWLMRCVWLMRRKVSFCVFITICWMNSFVLRGFCLRETNGVTMVNLIDWRVLFKSTQYRLALRLHQTCFCFFFLLFFVVVGKLLLVVLWNILIILLYLHIHSLVFVSQLSVSFVRINYIIYVFFCVCLLFEMDINWFQCFCCRLNHTPYSLLYK